MKQYTPILALIATSVMAFSQPALSQEAKPTIAVVNIQRVISESTAGKSITQQVEAKQKSFREEFSKKEQELQKEKQELSKKNSVLSKEAFEQKRKAFETKMTEEQKKFQGRKANYDAAFERALNDVQKSVNEIIAELSKEKGFSVAIPSVHILYADAKLDVTNEVLTRLNKKLPKIDINFEAPAKPAAPADKK